MPLDMHAQPHMKLQIFNVHVVPQCWNLNWEVNASGVGWLVPVAAFVYPYLYQFQFVVVLFLLSSSIVPAKICEVLL